MQQSSAKLIPAHTGGTYPLPARSLTQLTAPTTTSTDRTAQAETPTPHDKNSLEETSFLW